MEHTLIKDANIINEGKIFLSDVLIGNQRIEKIAKNIPHQPGWAIINAGGNYLIPGMIDAHVHFREPGMTSKGTIYSESRAAIAGGVTSFMDMPNTSPNTTTTELLEQKYGLASQSSFANYSFYMGVNSQNLEDVLTIDTENVCGLTDDGLYFDNKDSMLCNQPEYLEKLFSRANTLIALHCEDEKIITKNEKAYLSRYGERIRPEQHALIRSEEACVIATERVIELARKTKSRLHLLHISTGKEAELLEASLNLQYKKITGEACVHHLYFSAKDYALKGNAIKWNPSIKTEADRIGLLNCLKSNKLDSIATDHAPHLFSEKSEAYFLCKSGAPSVQHALPALFELSRRQEISLEEIVRKTSHAPAELFNVIDRGYIREGYYADLVLIDPDGKFETPEQLYYKTNWSPFAGENLRAKIKMTMVNGKIAFNSGHFTGVQNGLRLKFKKER
ncbi:MAG: dihydroorotase [Bacteroidia bacterium]|nr:dihydroorotase [Bacteroidia bacterium]